MNTVEKFNSSVDSLEKEMNELSEVAEVYKKVATAGESFKETIDKVKAAVTDLSTATKELNSHAKKMEEIQNGITAIQQENKNLKTFIMIAIAVGFVAVVIGIVLLAK